MAHNPGLPEHECNTRGDGHCCTTCGSGAVHPAYHPSSSRLFTAIKSRKRSTDDVCKKVADVLDAGVSIGVRDKMGHTALHVAAEMDDVPLCEMLLSRGADLAATTVQGETPLHGAAAAGALRACTWLLDHGVDVHARTVNGRTALFHAGYVSGPVCRLLLSRGIDAHVKDKGGYTALHAAAENGIVDACQAILDAGANPNVADREGKYTPLHLAAQEGHASTCKLLIERGADVTRLSGKGNTVFTLANNHGHTETMEELVRCGVDVNGLFKGVPLLLAVTFSSKMTPNDSGVRVLLQAGADPLKETEDGMSAFLGALLSPEVPVHVLEYFFTVTGRSPADYDRMNPAFHVLHAAALGGSLAKVQLLVRLGADVNKGWSARGGYIRMEPGATPADVAFSAGHPRLAQWLLHGGAGGASTAPGPGPATDSDDEPIGSALATRPPRRGGGRARRRHR